MLKPAQVKAMRQHMASNLEQFQALNSDSAFRKYYPEGIVGESQKRVDKEIAEAAEQEPILFQKQFYYAHAVEAELIPTDALLITVLDHYEASFKMMNFLRDGWVAK